MKNKIKKYICYLLIMCNIFILSGCSNENEEELLKYKLASQMQYFDAIISEMLNKANGLNFENYIVSAEKIEDEPQSGQSENDQNGQNKQDSSTKENSSNSEGSSNEKSTSSSENSSKNDYQYKMVENNILIAKKEPDWEALTADVENLYSNWSNVTLDLYKQNIDNQQILEFNTDLDNVTKAIKNKDKTQTLITLAKLYSYIPTYSAGFTDDQMQTNLYKLKSNVYNAYSIIEQNNQDEEKKQLQLAEEVMIAMMNNVGNKNQKEYNLNKAYILLKDLQTTVGKNDVDIFYLKYKNLCEELSIL